MRASLRTFVLTTHISLSVGWIGAVSAYLVLVAAGMMSPGDQTLRAVWIAMELIGWYAIVPLALASLLTGLIMSLGTRWGLFRHYWVLISFVLTIVAAAILLQHMPTVSFFASVAASADSGGMGDLRDALTGELLHAGVGVVVLLLVQALNVYKPQGMTAYGLQRASQVTSSSRSTGEDWLGPTFGTSRMPRWTQEVGIHAIGVVLFFVVLHFTGVGVGH